MHELHELVERVLQHYGRERRPGPSWIANRTWPTRREVAKRWGDFAHNSWLPWGYTEESYATALGDTTLALARLAARELADADVDTEQLVVSAAEVIGEIESAQTGGWTVVTLFQ